MLKEINIKSGVIGGVAGGVVFGMIMQMMGMMPMIAMMIGSQSVIIGWTLHLIISAITGLLFVLFVGRSLTSYQSGAGLGAVYGVIWWVLGALVIMPIILGMGVQLENAFDQMRMMSLMGHVIFGLLLGVVTYWHSKGV